MTKNLSQQQTIHRTTQILRRLHQLEHRWIATRTPDQISKLTFQGQLKLNEQLHYGELAFVLLRLKRCALIDYSGDREQLTHYISTVIEPTLQSLNSLGNSINHRLVCQRISHQLKSPEVPSWTGAYVLYDEEWDESREWANAHLLNRQVDFVSENELAKGLDYPGSLPSDDNNQQDAIVPVSYMGRMKSESGEWMSERWECLTSFIVQQHELPQLALHRIRYQAVRVFDIEIQPSMDTSMLEEFSSS